MQPLKTTVTKIPLEAGVKIITTIDYTFTDSQGNVSNFSLSNESFDSNDVIADRIQVGQEKLAKLQDLVSDAIDSQTLVANNVTPPEDTNP